MPPASRVLPSAAAPLLTALLVGAAPACAPDQAELDESSGAPEHPELVELGGPARGISITAVELNQGTAIELVRDGRSIPLAQRNAPLVSERDTLIRLHHTLDDPEGWIPRSLTGVLHIDLGEGEPERVRTRSLLVTQASDPRVLSSNFYFSLLAKEARPGVRYWIELRETDPSREPELASLGPGRSASPAEFEPIGFDATPLELQVVLVPVRYEHLDPPRIPDITDEDLALFHDLLYQQNPVQTLDIQIRSETIVWTDQITQLGALLAPTRAAKLADGAAPNVYYHALVDVGGPSVGGVGGIATLADAERSASANRVAVTVYNKHVVPPAEDAEDQTPAIYPPSSSARTFVHEIGHNQGFRHVACPNASAAGPDPDYPHADGKIGVHGFGIRNFHVYTPSAAHDYMSYCGNSWTSDWTWTKAHARIQALTAWDYESQGGQPGPGTTPVLIGLLFADGTEQWSVAAGAGATRGQARLDYWVDGERVASEAATVEWLSDDTTLMITAALPIAPARLEAVTRVHAGQRFAVDLGALRGF